MKWLSRTQVGTYGHEFSAYSLRGDEHKFVLRMRHLSSNSYVTHSRGVSNFQAQPACFNL